MLAIGQVVEDAASGFCGAVLRWERDLVILEDRHGKQRAFRLGAGFWYEGRPVVLKAPRARSVPTRTASGSVGGPTGRAPTALASIWCPGARSRALQTRSEAVLNVVTCWCWVIRTWTFGRR